MKRTNVAILFLVISQISILAQNVGQKIYAIDANSGDYFGQSVSIHGNYALIGANGAYNELSGDNDAGVAYFFKKVDGFWTFLQKIAEPEIRLYDDFGYTLDMNNNYAIIGAPQFGSSGAVFVYKKIGNEWQRQLKLPEYYRTEFGYSVAIDSNNIVVGAPDSKGWGPSSSWRGAAWVFSKTGIDDNETWTEVSKIAASDGYDNGHLGYDVDISGNYIIVGAWTASADYYGRSAAYIYEYENGKWVEKQRLFPNGTDTTTNHFGKCVSIFNEIAAVGAPEEPNESAVNGAVYIFEKNNSNWNESAKIISPDTSKFTSFGRSIDINDKKIIIGALNAVYIYEKNEASNWQLIDSVHNDYYNNGFGYSSFGESVSINDNVFLVGANDDCDKATLAGASHFYEITSNPTIDVFLLNEFNTIQIYPNPVNTTLNIDNIKSESRVVVYNSIGLKLKEIELTQTNKIDFSRYLEGIYFLTFINKRNEINTIKVIKN
jgi:hypothetical protein